MAARCSVEASGRSMVRQTIPSATCWTANRSGVAARMCWVSIFFWVVETTPTPARTAATPKLPVAEKHIAVSVKHCPGCTRRKQPHIVAKEGDHATFRRDAQGEDGDCLGWPGRRSGRGPLP